MNNDFTRSASCEVDYTKAEIFPLLCPKLEEKWIPGWKCDVLHSKSGFNEKGAVFRTAQAFGTELFWHTNIFDFEEGKVEFTLFAPDRMIFNFHILVQPVAEKRSRMTFTHRFMATGQEGNELIETYRKEDFSGRLHDLGRLITIYLKRQSRVL